MLDTADEDADIATAKANDLNAGENWTFHCEQFFLFYKGIILLTLYLSSFMLSRAEDFEKAYLSKEKGKEKP